MVLLMSTFNPHRGSFNFPDIINEKFVEWKQHYRDRTRNDTSNCLTLYPRMLLHSYEDAFDGLLFRSSERATQWGELSAAAIFSDTVGANLQCSYATGVSSTADRLPPDAWADLMELKAVKCRLELQLALFLGWLWCLTQTL